MPRLRQRFLGLLQRRGHGALRRLRGLRGRRGLRCRGTQRWSHQQAWETGPGKLFLELFLDGKNGGTLFYIYIYVYISYTLLAGGFKPTEKYESQLG